MELRRYVIKVRTIRIHISYLSVCYFVKIYILGGIDDPIVLQAALLHDTVEDTDTRYRSYITYAHVWAF